MKKYFLAICALSALLFFAACADSEITRPSRNVQIESRSSENQLLFANSSYGLGTINETTGARVHTFTGNHEFRPYGSSTWIDISSTGTITVETTCKCDNNGSGCNPHTTVKTDGTIDAWCDNGCTFGGCTMTNKIITTMQGGSGQHDGGGDIRPKN